MGWGHSWPCTLWDSEGSLSECVLPYHPVDPGDQSKILSLDDYHLHPLSHLTSPKVMFTTLRYWSGSHSVLPQAHDVPKSSRKNTHIFVLAKYITRCYSTREKEPSLWKAEDTDSGRLLLTPDDSFWCFSGWTLTMMRDETNDFQLQLRQVQNFPWTMFQLLSTEGVKFLLLSAHSRTLCFPDSFLFSYCPWLDVLRMCLQHLLIAISLLSLFPSTWTNTGHGKLKGGTISF